ncbi:MAG: hypothetical protein L0Y50_11285 [Beijerinckiaceae bacterium]|nr:hypothetical protein [Beijerinckiaceae bacterium]MCI0736831.1 hypothetical protein [Beijerinckiaceae bacterium]
MANEIRHGVKERVVSEARQFLVVFLYVWLLLAVFGLYKWVILADENIVQHQGFAILKALAFAKIMFVAEKMGLGEQFKEKPLIWPMLLKSALFAVLLMIFNLLEKAVEDRFWPHGAGRDAINMTSLQTILSVGVVMYVALIPFFGVRELSKVIGAAGMYRLLFVRRTLFVPLPEGTRLNVTRSRGKTGN